MTNTIIVKEDTMTTIIIIGIETEDFLVTRLTGKNSNSL
jgi:hypothetical protein